jgi:hypothetical protein
MPIQVQGNSGVVSEVGGTTFRAGHIHVKPLEYGSLGHYRLFVRLPSITALAANARIFEIRNTSATTLIVPTRLILRAVQTAAGTAQENSIDCFRVTGFSAVDTVNTTTITPSVRRTTGMTAAASAAAAIRAMVTANTAGMTGGTLTKDATAFASLPFNVAAAISTTFMWGPLDVFDDVNGTHPFVFAQNEGFEIENRVLNATSYGITWYVDFSWAEVSSF